MRNGFLGLLILIAPVATVEGQTQLPDTAKTAAEPKKKAIKDPKYQEKELKAKDAKSSSLTLVSRWFGPPALGPSDAVDKPPQHDDVFADHGQPYCPCLYAFADLLIIRPRGVDVPYAVPFNSVQPLGTPTGPVAVNGPDFNPGFRVGAGVRIAPQSYLQGTFTYFDGITNDNAGLAPAGSIDRALVAYPGAQPAAFAFPTALAADSRYRIAFRLADVDFIHNFLYGPCGNLWVGIGARYAHLSQDLHVNYTILGTTNVASRINFDGAGGRIGLGGNYWLKWGFYVYGQGFASILGGDFQSAYLQTNTFAGTQASTGVNSARVVPILDLEGGLGWETCGGHIRLQTGYYAAAWFNTLTTPTFIQGVQANNFTTNGNNFRDTLTFDGLAVRLIFRY